MVLDPQKMSKFEQECIPCRAYLYLPICSRIPTKCSPQHRVATSCRLPFPGSPPSLEASRRIGTSREPSPLSWGPTMLMEARICESVVKKFNIPTGQWKPSRRRAKVDSMESAGSSALGCRLGRRLYRETRPSNRKVERCFLDIAIP